MQCNFHFSQNRRSWIDDTRLTQSHIVLESESGGNESDNSIEDPPTSTASDTNLLHRNSHLRQSLQRKNEHCSTLLRGGVRNSFQATTRLHRNSIHG